MTLRRLPGNYDAHWNRPQVDLNRTMRLNFSVRASGDPVPERNRLQGGHFADRDTRVQTVAEMIAEMDEWIEPNAGFCGGFPTPSGGYLNLYARGKRYGRPVTALEMAERIVTKASGKRSFLDEIADPENPYEAGVFYARIGFVLVLFGLLAAVVTLLVKLATWLI